jgi:hypothetical protein
MRIIMQSGLAALVLLSANLAQADPPYKAVRDVKPADLKAIMKITNQFQEAIRDKNLKELSTLVLNDNILFSSPSMPDLIKSVEKASDVNFDGIDYAGYPGFVQFLRTSPQTLEEKFYNIDIVQDSNVAWVMFDYQFLVDGKISNHGVETWQMFKAKEEKWKILSVVWSSHDG